MPSGMFVKRVAKVINALYGEGNPITFTPIASITNPVIAGEELADVANTLRVMGLQGYVEVETDANGNPSYKLTESGAVMSDALYEEPK